MPEVERRLADRLINNEANALPEYIAYFEANKPTDDGQPTKEDPMEGMSVEQKIHYQILHRKKEGIEALLDEGLQTHSAVEILNDVLLPAMKEVFLPAPSTAKKPRAMAAGKAAPRRRAS